ncbi:MAG: polysaccharide biosynthesis/export family protein [Bacteroidales bacterium]|nr:polysaccharide biosynthesis/export family protein [Bacteroidales bacterium]
MRRFFKLIPLFVMVVVFLSSCTSQKNLIYLQGMENENGEIMYNYAENEHNYSPDYVLAEQDMLYIQITSTVGNEANSLFNGTASNNAMLSDNGLYLNGFVVDKNGEVGLPLIGKVYVKGLTVEQAEKKIKEKAEEFVQGAIVSCKMVNYKVSVLGEVSRPGTYTFYQPSVNIFDVIAAAGDLTYYGNRHEVKIVRKTSKEDIIYTLDLSEASILQDKRFYLQPGDLVYVQPNKSTKSLSTLNAPLGTITSSLSIIASVISLVTLVLSLNNK